MRFRELIRSEAGKFNWFSVVLLLIVALIAYAVVVFYPVYKDNTALNRFIHEQVLNSGLYEAPVIKQNIMDEAVRLGIPSSDFAVNVIKGSGRITIDCKYKRVVSYLGLKITREFTIERKNEEIRIPDSLEPHKNKPASDNN